MFFNFFSANNGEQDFRYSKLYIYIVLVFLFICLVLYVGSNVKNVFKLFVCVTLTLYMAIKLIQILSPDRLSPPFSHQVALHPLSKC